MTQTWYMVRRDKQPSRKGSGRAVERTNTATYPTPANMSTDNEQRILFSKKPRAAAEKRETPAEKALEVNKDLCTIRVPVNISIRTLSYNEKSKLSRLMVTATTSDILILLHLELVLQVSRKYNPRVMDVIGDQR